jgi:hypothetical protein
MDFPKRVKILSDVQTLYNEVIGQYNRYIGHVTMNIGGMNENFKTYDQKGPVYDFVNKSLQRDAVVFLNHKFYHTIMAYNKTGIKQV